MLCATPKISNTVNALIESKASAATLQYVYALLFLYLLHTDLSISYTACIETLMMDDGYDNRKQAEHGGESAHLLLETMESMKANA